MAPPQATAPSTSNSQGDSDFLSNVAINQKGNLLNYRIVIGPYDTESSPRLKSSNGWVTLMLIQGNGQTIPSLKQGIKIEIADFETLYQHDTPVGWVHSDSLLVPNLPHYKTERFSVGWVLP